MTAIIIVNWNGFQHLEVCLKSLFNQTYKDFKVFFVDNGSTDESVVYVRKNFPQVTVLIEEKNKGFAEGNNIGIRRALQSKDFEYIVTLNNDTEVDENWLRHLVEHITNEVGIGAVCSKMLFFQERNKIDSTGDFFLPNSLKVVTRGYGEIDKGQYDTPGECFSARAGAAIYRSQMLEDVSLNGDYFDSIYFAYIEDTDLSIRARLRGWKIMYEPRAIVFHKVASTTKKISYEFRKYYSGRNRIFTAVKNYPISMWLLVLRGRESVDADYHLSLEEKIKVYLRIVFSIILLSPELYKRRKIIQKRKKVSTFNIKQWRRMYSLEGKKV